MSIKEIEMKFRIVLICITLTGILYGQTIGTSIKQSNLPIVYSYTIESITPETQFSSTGWTFNSGYGPKNDNETPKEWFYKSINNISTDYFNIKFTFNTQYQSNIDSMLESNLVITISSKIEKPIFIDWNNLQILVDNKSIQMEPDNHGYPNIVPGFSRIDQSYKFHNQNDRLLGFIGRREIPVEIITNKQLVNSFKSTIAKNITFFIPLTINNNSQFYKISCVIDKAYIFENESVYMEMDLDS